MDCTLVGEGVPSIWFFYMSKTIYIFGLYNGFFFIKIQHITGEILGEAGFQFNEHTVYFFLNFVLVFIIKK